MVETDRPAWIRTTIDGRVDGARVFAAGEKKTVLANRDIVLRAGDAGAVFVSLNGAERKALGPRGSVATRRFAADVPQAPGSLPSLAPSRPTTNAAAPNVANASPASAPAVLPADVVFSRTPSSAAPPLESLRRADEPPSSAGATLKRAAEQWLDAYYRAA